MKLILLKAILMMFVLGTSVAVAVPSVFDPEASGAEYSIARIDVKKKIIKFEGVELAYDKTTQFFDANGKKITSKSLRSDSTIKFEYDHTKRYVSRPTATKIWILPSNADY